MKKTVNPNLIPHMWRNESYCFETVLKDDWFSTVAMVESDIAVATYKYFEENHVAPVLMPVTCSSVSSPIGLGSDSVPVSVYLWENKVYLADSMQFQLEFELRKGFDSVGYIMPSFRGELADERHLNEFFHIEAELRIDFDDCRKFVQGLLKYITGYLLSRHEDRIRKYAGSVDHCRVLLNLQDFNIVKFQETPLILENDEECFSWLDETPIGLTRKGEQLLLEKLGDFIWVVDLPAFGVPFYQKDNDDGNTCNCGDLLFGIGEVVGAGQRHEDATSLINALIDRQVNPSEYEWYIEMKRISPLVSSGFGIGVERYLLWLFQHDDIRDLQVFMRTREGRFAP